MSYFEKTELLESMESLVMRLQHNFDEKTFNKLYHKVYKMMFGYLYSWKTFTTEQIEEILQQYYINGFQTSISNYKPQKALFSSYVANMVRKRAYTMCNKINKIKKNMNDLSVWGNKLSTWYNKKKETIMYNNVNTQLEEDFKYFNKEIGMYNNFNTECDVIFKDYIKTVINNIRKLIKPEYRSRLYYGIIMDLDQRQKFHIFLSRIYSTNEKCEETWAYRAEKQLKSLSEIRSSVSIIPELRKYILIRDKDINDIVLRIRNSKDQVNFSDIVEQDINKLKEFVNKLLRTKNIEKFIQIGE